MAFKMRSGNKPAFKSMGSSESPMKLSNWSGWMANRQKFIGDEIEGRRKRFAKNQEEEEKKKETKTTETKPVVKEETPVVKEETPVVEKKEPVVKKEEPVVEEKTTSGRVEHALSESNPELNKYVVEEPVVEEPVVEEPVVQDNQPKDDTETTDKKDDTETTDKKDDTEKPKPKTNKRLRSYEEAWDSDLHFTTSDDGKTKTAPKELGGASYPNTPEGYKAFVDASEKWWKEQQEKKLGENLNIDSQTGKQSTHEVWKEE